MNVFFISFRYTIDFFLHFCDQYGASLIDKGCLWGLKRSKVKESSRQNTASPYKLQKCREKKKYFKILTNKSFDTNIKWQHRSPNQESTSRLTQTHKLLQVKGQKVELIRPPKNNLVFHSTSYWTVKRLIKNTAVCGH